MVKMKNKSFNQETWEKAIEKFHELGISTVHEDGTLLTGYELLEAMEEKWSKLKEIFNEE